VDVINIGLDVFPAGLDAVGCMFLALDRGHEAFLVCGSSKSEPA
jgi:hypothetical protein